MYWSNQEVDNTIYPPCCPGCHALKWLDFDWETGLGYCRLCGWDPDNNLLSSGDEGSRGS
jgi:hypothetical protein